jgi:hypothetical protein
MDWGQKGVVETPGQFGKSSFRRSWLRQSRSRLIAFVPFIVLHQCRRRERVPVETFGRACFRGVGDPRRTRGRSLQVIRLLWCAGFSRFGPGLSVGRCRARARNNPIRFMQLFPWISRFTMMCDSSRLESADFSAARRRLFTRPRMMPSLRDVKSDTLCP